jgi:hypothetical protein
MGDVSKSVLPASSAARASAARSASAALPRTSNVRQVPMPTAGTSSPVRPSDLVSNPQPPFDNAFANAITAERRGAYPRP